MVRLGQIRAIKSRTGLRGGRVRAPRNWWGTSNQHATSPLSQLEMQVTWCLLISPNGQQKLSETLSVMVRNWTWVKVKSFILKDNHSKFGAVARSNFVKAWRMCDIVNQTERPWQWQCGPCIAVSKKVYCTFDWLYSLVSALSMSVAIPFSQTKFDELVNKCHSY